MLFIYLFIHSLTQQISPVFLLYTRVNNKHSLTSKILSVWCSIVSYKIYESEFHRAKAILVPNKVPPGSFLEGIRGYLLENRDINIYKGFVPPTISLNFQLNP